MVGAFNPFTFKVITDKYDPVAIYFIVLGSNLYTIFGGSGAGTFGVPLEGTRLLDAISPGPWHCPFLDPLSAALLSPTHLTAPEQSHQEGGPKMVYKVEPKTIK